MLHTNKIQYYDLRLEQTAGRIPRLIGRSTEQERLTRIMFRNLNHNAFVIGPNGIGKTTFLRGWAAESLSRPENTACNFLELTAESFADTSLPNVFSKTAESLERIPNNSIVIIDGFGELVFGKNQLIHSLVRLCKILLSNKTIHLILTATAQEYDWVENEHPGFTAHFEKLDLKEQPEPELIAILENTYGIFKKQTQVHVNMSSLASIVQISKRFSRLGQLPKGAIAVLDEAMAEAKRQKALVLSDLHTNSVVAAKAGIPLSQLGHNETGAIRDLESNLNKAVIGQERAIKTISSIITRAKLGLKNPQRPLGSFLILGPSGVGKTETAKMLTELVYGKRENFLRFDMSEFAESHTTQRLIGAPAGYVGFEAGGGLTSPIKAEPHSLVLLDEIEKAHPKIFDIFLQVLDDGRLSSGAGETIDFTQTILMATSNIGTSSILTAHEEQRLHDPDFVSTYIIPELTKYFRLEFINRFDAIVIFKPFSKEDLLSIAKLEVAKLEKRMERFNVSFAMDTDVLREHIEQLHDPRFGARPLKRYIEEVCENLVAEMLIQKP